MSRYLCDYRNQVQFHFFIIVIVVIIKNIKGTVHVMSINVMLNCDPEMVCECIKTKLNFLNLLTSQNTLVIGHVPVWLIVAFHTCFKFVISIPVSQDMLPILQASWALHPSILLPHLLLSASATSNMVTLSISLSHVPTPRVCTAQRWLLTVCKWLQSHQTSLRHGFTSSHHQLHAFPPGVSTKFITGQWCSAGVEYRTSVGWITTR